MKTKGYIFATLILASVLSLALCGCGKDTEEAPATENAVTTTTSVTATTTVGQSMGESFPFMGYVNATTLNVRPTPDTNGYAIGGLKWGEAVTILSREGDWYAIRFGDRTGYIHAQYVQDTMPTKATETVATTAPTTVDATGTTAVVGP